MRFILDTNIYNLLAMDDGARERLVRAVAMNRLQVMATPKIIDELGEGPHGGLPKWFQVDIRSESVAVLGHWKLGQARLGEGRVFKAHRGRSKKVADAIIADSANSYADVLVSEDRRARKRLSDISTSCVAMTYAGFCDWLKRNA